MSKKLIEHTMQELIEELEQYKKLNKTIDIDFVIILNKLHLKNQTT